MLNRPPRATITTTGRLLGIFSREGNPCALAEVNGFRSTSFAALGALDSAMACAHRALNGFRPGCDSLILIRGHVAMSYLYLKLKEYNRADSACTLGLSLWDPSWKKTVLRNSLLINKAIAAARRGNLDEAEAGFRTILALAAAEGAQQVMYDAMINLGAMKDFRHQLDSAEFYFRASLANAVANGKVGRMATVYTNLATLAIERRDAAGAGKLLDKALFYADSAKDLSLQVEIHGKLAKNYHRLGDLGNAFRESTLQYELNDSLLNMEKVRTLAEMQAKFERAKQDKEILALKAANLGAELGKSQVQRMRNIYLFLGLGILGLSIGLWARLRHTRRSRAAIQKERDISEGLLRNILPKQVAEELKANGTAEARHIDQVTVLFTDFKNFTGMSEKLSPRDLVHDLNECFSAFDLIMEKYGIEKIKTIGDAYMAAGGLPTPSTTHALDVVKAAFEIRDFIAAGQQPKIDQGLPFFEIRIGIHTGPVVAGIVGVKKFAYDIWGDTVNTASHMESSGQVGQVNISGSTYALVKDAPGLTFIPRGKVKAKGKGELDMYFVRESGEGA